MDIKGQYKFYKFGELAYKKAYSLYQPIYFYWKGRKDKEKIDFLREYIKPGMTVIDIGANIGFYSALFAKMVGEKGRVYSFEPDPVNFSHLVSNTKKFKNATVNNAAVSDKSGTIKLYRYNLNVEFKTYDVNGESTDFTEIKCVSLDDYFKNGETADVVKTDTEGYDYFVINGMKELIRRSKNLVLITEFWPYMLNKSGITPGQFITQLKEMGFTTIKFTDANAEELYDKMVNERFFYTDIIAIKSSPAIG
ncbi:MAG TPA: FkbM family methyltransferase [Bacteroidia bacterium]|nr:FkbM family methyltransferase [Bacteroidia bacterium]